MHHGWEITSLVFLFIFSKGHCSLTSRTASWIAEISILGHRSVTSPSIFNGSANSSTNQLAFRRDETRSRRNAGIYTGSLAAAEETGVEATVAAVLSHFT